MSPSSVILYIFYGKTIKQCLAFIAGLKINHSRYKEESEVMVPTVCFRLELGNLNSPPNLLLHTHTCTHALNLQRIVGLQSFLAQFPSFVIRVLR